MATNRKTSNKKLNTETAADLKKISQSEKKTEKKGKKILTPVAEEKAEILLPVEEPAKPVKKKNKAGKDSAKSTKKAETPKTSSKAGKEVREKAADHPSKTAKEAKKTAEKKAGSGICLLYTSPSPRD